MSILSAKAHLSASLSGCDAKQTPSGSAWLNGFRYVRAKLRQRRQLQDLAALDDRLLDDVGITREQAERALHSTGWNLIIQLRRGDCR